MNANRNITELRERLFAQLDALNDSTKPADIARARAVCEVSQTIINSLKVEMEFLAIVQGAADVPFLESQSTPTQATDTSAPAHLTAVEKTAQMLLSGPRSDHPWNRQSTRAKVKGAAS